MSPDPDSGGSSTRKRDSIDSSDVVVPITNPWWKFDVRILPLAAMLYFLSFLDRSNIANARVAGMQKDLKMSNFQYSVALTVTYVPYTVAELPSNLLLKYVGPDLMLPTMVTLWGVVCTLQGVVHDYSGLLACRFFLGLLEGGLFPGLVLYLSFFYPRQRLQLRISIFFAAASLSGAFSGLLAAAIINMDGIQGKAGWSWIFILEGIFTFAFGLASFFLMPRSPLEATFLTKEEKDYVSSQLIQDGVMSDEAGGDAFSWREVGRAFQRPQVAFMAIAGFCAGTTLYGLAYFEPTIVSGLGHYSPVKAQLMSVPPFAVAFVLSVFTSFVSDRYRARGLTMIFFSVICVIGFAMFLGSDSKHVKYGSLFLSLPGTYCLAPALSTWNANNTAPHVRRATAIAIVFMLTNSGGILATWLLGSLSPAPKYTKAAITFVVFSVVILLCAVANMSYLSRQNRQKAEIRSKSEKKEEPKGLGDRSAWFVYNL